MTAQISQRLFLQCWSSGRAPVSKTGEWGSIPQRCAIPVSSSGRTARCQRANPSSNLGTGSTLFLCHIFLRAWPIGRGTGFPNRLSRFDSCSTVQCPRHLTDRIRDYESRHGGSNPPEGAIISAITSCGHLTDRIPLSEGGHDGKWPVVRPSSPSHSATLRQHHRSR